MGQYFTPVFLNTDDAIVAALNPGDYGSGDKLFGHTRADTRLIYAVQTVLALDGGLRLVWAGDYAPEEPGRSANLYFLTEDRHFLRFAGLVNDELTPNTALPNGKSQAPSATSATSTNTNTSKTSPSQSTTQAGDGHRCPP